MDTIKGNDPSYTFKIYSLIPEYSDPVFRLIARGPMKDETYVSQNSASIFIMTRIVCSGPLDPAVP